MRVASRTVQGLGDSEGPRVTGKPLSALNRLEQLQRHRANIRRVARELNVDFSSGAPGRRNLVPQQGKAPDAAKVAPGVTDAASMRQGSSVSSSESAPAPATRPQGIVIPVIGIPSTSKATPLSSVSMRGTDGLHREAADAAAPSLLSETPEHEDRLQQSARSVEDEEEERPPTIGQDVFDALRHFDPQSASPAHDGVVQLSTTGIRGPALEQETHVASVLSSEGTLKLTGTESSLGPGFSPGRSPVSARHGLSMEEREAPSSTCQAHADKCVACACAFQTADSLFCRRCGHKREAASPTKATVPTAENVSTASLERSQGIQSGTAPTPEEKDMALGAILDRWQQQLANFQHAVETASMVPQSPLASAHDCLASMEESPLLGKDSDPEAFVRQIKRELGIDTGPLKSLGSLLSPTDSSDLLDVSMSEVLPATPALPTFTPARASQPEKQESRNVPGISPTSAVTDFSHAALPEGEASSSKPSPAPPAFTPASASQPEKQASRVVPGMSPTSAVTDFSHAALPEGEASSSKSSMLLVAADTGVAEGTGALVAGGSSEGGAISNPPPPDEALLIRLKALEAEVSRLKGEAATAAASGVQSCQESPRRPEEREKPPAGPADPAAADPAGLLNSLAFSLLSSANSSVFQFDGGHSGITPVPPLRLPSSAPAQAAASFPASTAHADVEPGRADRVEMEVQAALEEEKSFKDRVKEVLAQELQAIPTPLPKPCGIDAQVGTEDILIDAQVGTDELPAGEGPLIQEHSRVVVGKASEVSSGPLPARMASPSQKPSSQEPESFSTRFSGVSHAQGSRFAAGWRAGDCSSSIRPAVPSQSAAWAVPSPKTHSTAHAIPSHLQSWAGPCLRGAGWHAASQAAHAQHYKPSPVFSQQPQGPAMPAAPGRVLPVTSSSSSSPDSQQDDAMLMRAYEVYRRQQIEILSTRD
eukprot:TRINITY_DN826_c0_g1_i1.p1 TRINITY_DN826_c0_g1~~TRINITY_DN826_c0_g1_i1.p1  ORF type:complete len:938 (+),score=163.52 TRINITY_DN826_c0_g1_i1:109-2922(+)